MTFTVQVRRALTRLPLISPCLRAVYRALVPPTAFQSSDEYWKARYRRSANSGEGSYGRLADFKASVLNEFVAAEGIGSVIEWGCGDGNQLVAAKYPKYTGVDISPAALRMCRSRFSHDASKQFLLYSEAEKSGATAELALSLDVIYHLVEDQTFDAYMRALIKSGTRFIGVYSSDRDEPGHVPHVRHRSFSAWLNQHAPQWKSFRFIENPYKYDPADPDRTSWADFRFFKI
jgi:hypothetical protein